MTAQPRVGQTKPASDRVLRIRQQYKQNAIELKFEKFRGGLEWQAARVQLQS